MTRGALGILRRFGSENSAESWVGSNVSPSFVAKTREGPVEAALSGSGYSADMYPPLLRTILTLASANPGSE